MVGVSVGPLYTCDALLCCLVPCLFCWSCKYTLRLATLTAYILPPLYTQNTLSLLDGCCFKVDAKCCGGVMIVLLSLLVNFAICRNSHQKIQSHNPTRAHAHSLPRPPTPQHTTTSFIAIQASLLLLSQTSNMDNYVITAGITLVAAYQTGK